MAIAPNTTFTSGAILTAAQMNALPWGIVAIASVTANDTFTTEEVEITSSTFTAVANRYYRVTYVEPVLYGALAGVAYMKIKNGATVLQSTYVTLSAAYESNAISFVVKTFTAGSITLTGTLQLVVGTNGTAQRSATQPAQIIIEDVGPA